MKEKKADRDSGSARMFQILKLLHELSHRVAFIPDNLADTPPYTAELQRRGRAWAAGFSWERSARATLAVYREAAGQQTS